MRLFVFIFHPSSKSLDVVLAWFSSSFGLFRYSLFYIYLFIVTTMSFLPVSSLLRVLLRRNSDHYFARFSTVAISLSSFAVLFLSLLFALSPLLPVASPMHAVSERACLERIWPDFQRCREKQREHFRYGHFSFGLSSFSTDVYQPKYRTECCSYWELIECVHKASEAYCTNEVDLKKLHSFLEMVGVSVPLYVCADEVGLVGVGV